MTQTDLRTLLDRGRKAGLRTSDIYQALSARRAGLADPPSGQPDSNGFISTVDRDGHRVYRPEPTER